MDEIGGFDPTIGQVFKEGKGNQARKASEPIEENGHPLDYMGHEFIGFTVGDGFKFGCGFTLAVAIGVLAALILATIFMIIGALLGFKPPFAG